jgi:hypothetical protein
MTFRKWFNDFISEHDFSDLYTVEKSDYFRGITQNTDYWKIHLDMLEEYGIDDAASDISICDVGVWFGVWPYALKEYGFSNVYTTECQQHSISKQDSFSVLHPRFGIDPQELHIKPGQAFDLPGGQHDLITIMKSNVFWKTTEVIHYDGVNVNTQWQVTGADDVVHTFFTLYDVHDWEFFIDNIRKCLRPGGKALINPEPWCYDQIEHLSETRKFLEQYLQKTYNYKNQLSNFLVIEK